MPQTQRNIKFKLFTFLALLLILSTVVYCLFFSNIIQSRGLFGLCIMWVPGVAALMTRLILDKNLRQLGWRWGKTRFHIVSYVLPLILCVVVYGFTWISGLGKMTLEIIPDGLMQAFPVSEEPLSLGASIIVLLFLGTLVGGIHALGEEIGWRGFFTYELAKITSHTRTSLIVGLIWAVWHYPGILFMSYNSGTPSLYSIPCFTIMIVASSFIYTWMRIKSGSVWTAVFFHTGHNLFIQGFFDPVTENTGMTNYITTEFGIGLAVMYSLAAYVFWKKRSFVDQFEYGA